MFNNSNVQSNIKKINGNPFNLLLSFGMYSSSDTVYYYVMDLCNGVFILMLKRSTNISVEIISSLRINFKKKFKNK